MDRENIILSVIKTDLSLYCGQTYIHPAFLDAVKEELIQTKEKSIIKDFHILRCGVNLELITTHKNGADSDFILELAYKIFTTTIKTAEELKINTTTNGENFLKGSSLDDLLKRGQGLTEIECSGIKSEPIVIFMADKTSSGAWNLPLFKIFTDPFNTPNLLFDDHMNKGFTFDVMDIKNGGIGSFKCPEEIYGLLAFIGISERYAVCSVYRKIDGQISAAASTHKPIRSNGEVIENNAPVLVVRCQTGMPTVGEALEAFSFPYMVRGWMGGIHNGPLMPVPFYEASPSRFDGPPRLIAAGFQLAAGRLIGPHDMFDDPSFDETRKKANIAAEYLRRHGPFQPHRVSPKEVEKSNLPQAIIQLKGRFKKDDRAS